METCEICDEEVNETEPTKIGRSGVWELCEGCRVSVEEVK